MSREALIALLFDVAPDWWDGNDIGITTDAILESDHSRDAIAHELWTYGMNADHEGCLYADGDNDADYENRCGPCITYLADIAAQIEAALR